MDALFKLLGGERWPEKWSAIGSIFSGIVALLGQQWAIVMFIAGLMFFFGLLVGRRRAVREPPSASRLVDALHRRWFPGDHAGLDIGYRVSLWTPQPSAISPEHWRCEARTGPTGPCKRIWSNPSTSDEARYAGLVATSAFEQSGLAIEGLPVAQRTSPDAVGTYRRRSHLREDLTPALTWPYASLRTSVVRAANGTIRCVLLVERESGESPQIKGRLYQATDGAGSATVLDVCEEELSLAAAVWSAATEKAN